ncbi:MAG: DUF2752 domain-containing protein [Actinomycetota bacterium]|nr:DUF2752 domain-containing protein [Actinomycetota bacterium]
MAVPYATEPPPGHPRPGVLAAGLTGVAIAVGYLAVADPHDRTAIMPRCPLELATGLDCPSCGGLRMAHHLLHGQVRAAARDNLLLVALSPLLLHLVYRLARSLATGERYEVPRRPAAALLIVALAWGIVRNLARWPWKPTLG